ncbi:SNF2-related protein [Fibrobacter sp.]|uniref:SNF2-related protein n=1 Tax=Fibrobacter sp. TaxID=35828 RepID=UPI0025BEC0DF|nr:SNF2-related protein [Fibrobacter sp.]MBR3070947.1 restriction endonuclease [Fibrobacter sp.]
MFDIIDNKIIFQYNNLENTPKNLVLKRLLDNDLATEENSKCIVPILNIYELDSFEQSLLELPEIYPYTILIEGKGILTTPNFCYKISFRTFQNGKILPKLQYNGPIVKFKIDDDEIDYLLTKEQYKLISSINDFNNLSVNKKSNQKNLESLSQIQILANEATAILDSTLRNREIVNPKKIKVHLSQNELQSDFGSKNNEEFEKQIDEGLSVKNIYSARRNNESSYLTLNDNTKKVVEQIKKQRKTKNPTELQKIIEHPEEFFDPESADLSEFYSERVIGIGLYEPKVYPFISPYKSEWIPSFKIEDRTNGTKNLVIHSINELTALEETLNSAKKDNLEYFDFNGINLTIPNAEKIISHAKDVLSKKEPVENKGPNSIENKKETTQVLIIEDNVEKIGFDQSTGQIALPKTAILKKDEALKKGITLKRHQEEGIAWLQYCLENAQGVLLGDDMGLGKTLQVLYLIDWHYRNLNKDNKPYLIIAPVTLLENWKNEYQKFFENGMTFDIIRQIPAPNDEEFISKHSFKHIMLMSYECLRRGQLAFGKLDFAIIAIDEAQKIKEPGTMVTNAVKALKGDFKIAMTGTPVENTFMNLWCIMDFAVPGYLGTAKEFAKKYQAPLRNPSTDIEKLGQELHKELGGYFLRRLKCDVAKELPSKHLVSKEILMPTEQLNRYLMSIDIGGKPEPGDALHRIQELKRISDHPYLDEKCWDDLSNNELINSSAKLIATIKILDEIQSKGEKVIIFTERRDMQRMLQRIILDKYDLAISIINGETNTTTKGNNPSRQKTIDNFQEKEGFNIIIMSQLAAGIGLNVVGANHVIHYSRHWNPAKENQATDRVYRIGQTKDVFIYYPMAIAENFDSFDKVLDGLLKRKMNLANASLYPTDQIEVKLDDLESRIFSSQASCTNNNPITKEEIRTMDEYLFESFVATLFSKLGFNCRVTPKSGDKGVDILAYGTENYAIQCKHGKNNVGNEAVQEVVAGAKYYESIELKSFKTLVVSNSFFSQQATELANANNVKLIDGNELNSKQSSLKITWRNVYEMERNRMK